jgi:hypothetical protein
VTGIAEAAALGAPCWDALGDPAADAEADDEGDGLAPTWMEAAGV